jgi:hypothetical protein
MAAVVFIEHLGQRIDITRAERTIETRCDVCGEFVPRGEAVTVNLSVNALGSGPHHDSIEGHAGHVLDKVVAVIRQVAQEIPNS